MRLPVGRSIAQFFSRRSCTGVSGAGFVGEAAVPTPPGLGGQCFPGACAVGNGEGGNPMNSRERVRDSTLTCRRPDRIPMALAFWESFRRPSRTRPATTSGWTCVSSSSSRPRSRTTSWAISRAAKEVHVGNLGQLQTYHEWNYHPEHGPDGPLSHGETADHLPVYLPRSDPS